MTILLNFLVLILVIALIGFVVYLITTKIPMDDSFRQLIIVVVVIAIVLYVIAFLTGHASMSLPALR